MDQKLPGLRIDYIEFAVVDLEAAKRFYSSVCGWKMTDWGPDYSSFTDGRLSGGFARVPAVTPGGPLVVLYAADLSKVEQAVVENAGTIVKGVYEFPGGRRFHFRDPAGYELAIWSE
jgi:predicted enzyme related to lactoylglutathione lyase